MQTALRTVVNGTILRAVLARRRLPGPSHPATLNFLESISTGRRDANVAKTARMQQLEAMLAEDPSDPFLRYGLAMEHASQGDDEAAVAVLRDLITQTSAQPYVPAFLQAGQALMRLGRDREAAAVLRDGIQVARLVGNDHALGEMQGLLATLE